MSQSNGRCAVQQGVIVKFIFSNYSGLIADDNSEGTEVIGKLQTSFIKGEGFAEQRTFKHSVHAGQVQLMGDLFMFIQSCD